MSIKSILILTVFLILSSSCNNDNSSSLDGNSIPKEKAVLTLIANTNFNCNLARFSKDGNYLVGSLNQFWVTYSSTEPELVYLFDIKKNELVKKFKLHANVDEFDCVAISPDGKYIAGGGAAYNGWFGRGVVVWDIATGSYHNYNNDFDGFPKFLEYTPSGDTLFVYTTANNLYIWDLNTYQIEAVNKGYTIYSKDFFHLSPDGKYALFSGYVDVVDLSVTPATCTDGINAEGADFLPDYERIIMTYRNTVKIYELATGNILKTFNDDGRKYHYKIAVSPSGKYFATSYDVGDDEYSIEENGIQIWDALTLKQIGNLIFDNLRKIKYLEFGIGDSKLLATTDSGAEVYEINYELIQ